jgi:glycosyltransferase involved in cell wall biosynthesis
MKIALIGPGIMPIPPPGWGAVEILIWDYYNELRATGHDVIIINKIRREPSEQSNPGSAYCREIINEINQGCFDFVHIHYDVLFHIIPFITTARVIGITSHYPYIDNPGKHPADGFTSIFQFMIRTPQVASQRLINFVLADKDITALIQNGADARYITKLENGISADKFIWKTNLERPLVDKTIYLGKITTRKGQARYCNLEGIHIVGPGGQGLANYKGAWTRDEVYNKLSDYGNLLLLSDGEADPLVVKEAMMAGLGVVVNETSGKNLSRECDFISFIPDSRCDDMDYIQCIIDNNRKISYQKRDLIKQYALEHFSWQPLINRYIEIIQSQLSNLNYPISNYIIINRFNLG